MKHFLPTRTACCVDTIGHESSWLFSLAMSFGNETKVRLSSPVLRRSILGAVMLALAGIGAATADEFVEIAVPLREGCYFSPRDFCQQCNERLGTHFPLGLITDQEH